MRSGTSVGTRPSRGTTPLPRKRYRDAFASRDCLRHARGSGTNDVIGNGCEQKARPIRVTLNGVAALLKKNHSELRSALCPPHRATVP